MAITVDLSKFKIPTSSQLATATFRSLNHTMSKAITAGNRAVTKEWNIKLKDLKGYQRVSKASRAKLSTSLILKSRPISLMKFGAKQKRRGVGYKIKKAGGRKTLDHAFIATTKNNNFTGVFIRKGKTRLPLNVFKSITPSSMYNKTGREALFEKMEEDYNKRFLYELGRLRR